jgi:hypothetical protein
MKEQRIPALMFWPEKRINQTFQEAARGIKAGDELKALRIFYRRMQSFLKTSAKIDMSTGLYEGAIIAARYEKPLVEKDIAVISGGTV